MERDADAERPASHPGVAERSRLDEDDVRDLALLRRERERRDNGREASDSLVVRDLIRAAITALRARETSLRAADS